MVFFWTRAVPEQQDYPFQPPLWDFFSNLLIFLNLLHAAEQQNNSLLQDKALYLQIPPDWVQAVQHKIPQGVEDTVLTAI